MKRVLAMCVILAAAQAAVADCKPHRLLKIVTAAELPDVPAGDFRSQPRTMYRLGDRYARLEEPLNTADNVHLLIVVNEPDVWMVNRTDMTGRHIVDPGPTFEFHAPVLDAVESEFWRQLELGCEEPFMKAVGALKEELPTGTVKYTHSAEGTTVTLTLDRGIPTRVDIAAPKLTYGIRYLVFEMLADTSTERFQRPEPVRYSRVEASQ